MANVREKHPQNSLIRFFRTSILGTWNFWWSMGMGVPLLWVPGISLDHSHLWYASTKGHPFLLKWHQCECYWGGLPRLFVVRIKLPPRKLTWQWKNQPFEVPSPIKKMVILQLAMLVYWRVNVMTPKHGLKNLGCWIIRVSFTQIYDISHTNHILRMVWGHYRCRWNILNSYMEGMVKVCTVLINYHETSFGQHFYSTWVTNISTAHGRPERVCSFNEVVDSWAS